MTLKKAIAGSLKTNVQNMRGNKMNFFDDEEQDKVCAVGRSFPENLKENQ